MKKHPDIHQSNAATKSSGKRIQDSHSRGDPFCESVVTILGLVKRGKDCEDCLGGIAWLKAGKERTSGQILLGLAIVSF